MGWNPHSAATKTGADPGGEVLGVTPFGDWTYASLTFDGTVDPVPSKSLPVRLNEMTANSFLMHIGINLSSYFDGYNI